MRRLLLCITAAVFVSGIIGTAAFAAKNVVVKPLQTIEATPMLVGPMVPSVACQVGNLNSPYWAITNFMLPPETYKLVFDPATCSVCPLGLSVTSVHILLQVDEPTTIVMSADVEESIPSPACATAPGPEWCVSPLYSVALPYAGLWDVRLPISCNCLPPIGKYLLSIHFDSYQNALGSVPTLVTDAGPGLLCTNWNNYGFGWDDLVATYAGWPGNLNIYADVECCSPPVPVEKHSWGEIKGLYKN